MDELDQVNNFLAFIGGTQLPTLPKVPPRSTDQDVKGIDASQTNAKPQPEVDSKSTSVPVHEVKHVPKANPAAFEDEMKTVTEGSSGAHSERMKTATEFDFSVPKSVSTPNPFLPTPQTKSAAAVMSSQNTDLGNEPPFSIDNPFRPPLHELQEVGDITRPAINEPVKKAPEIKKEDELSLAKAEMKNRIAVVNNRTRSANDSQDSLSSDLKPEVLKTNTEINVETLGQSNRKDQVFFSQWGAPTTREQPPARARQIILSGLPMTTDFSLIQSLIYGGAIESMKLSPHKKIAYITFTTADACDAYSEKYPNGFDMIWNRGHYSILVDKCQEVAIVSGKLQGYLDCGASRVVRATGADEDWGLRALRKLAEGNGRTVETIVDTYRNEIRTIIFRFTNISDAVAFKGMLIRDDDWESCNIQFMVDPCEKAKAFHFD